MKQSGAGGKNLILGRRGEGERTPDGSLTAANNEHITIMALAARLSKRKGRLMWTTDGRVEMKAIPIAVRLPRASGTKGMRP